MSNPNYAEIKQKNEEITAKNIAAENALQTRLRSILQQDQNFSTGQNSMLNQAQAAAQKRMGPRQIAQPYNTATPYNFAQNRSYTNPTRNLQKLPTGFDKRDVVAPPPTSGRPIPPDIVTPYPPDSDATGPWSHYRRPGSEIPGNVFIDDGFGRPMRTFAGGGMASSHLSPDILQKAEMLSKGINPYQ